VLSFVSPVVPCGSLHSRFFRPVGFWGMTGASLYVGGVCARGRDASVLCAFGYFSSSTNCMYPPPHLVMSEDFLPSAHRIPRTWWFFYFCGAPTTILFCFAVRLWVVLRAGSLSDVVERAVSRAANPMRFFVIPQATVVAAVIFVDDTTSMSAPSFV